ncbi:MAG: hypothetical protein QXP56_04560 [Archaeoglobaceae archaeon]
MKITMLFRAWYPFEVSELQLELIKHFLPSRLYTEVADLSYNFKIQLEGAKAVNPWKVLERIKEKFDSEGKPFPSFTITNIEVENEEEKDKLATWILESKLS